MSSDFDERFRETVIQGVLALLWAGRLSQQPGAAMRAALHQKLYEYSTARLASEVASEMDGVRTH
jgi:hypothetical protein